MRWYGLSAAALGAALLLGACLAAAAATAPAGAGQPTQVRQIDIDGPIGPATSHYVHSQIVGAQAAGAELILLRIDTPGGLSKATRKIVQDILASPIPVIGFVAPRGARAASAGTYILYATHIAAMAPATHLGAATPILLGGGAAPAAGPDEQKNGDTIDRSNQTALRRKIVNDAVAFIRSLARQRGRNADWAEAAVRRGVSLTAARALEMNVIDLMAGSRAELFDKIDGMTAHTVAGDVTLATARVRVVQTEPGWRTQLLGIITQPAVAYLLLIIGIFGLLFEGLSPGAVLPGVLGGICLLVALYAFQILPVNYAGLGLIALGVILMVGEMFMPSFGALGIGGVAAFAFGSIMLMDTDVPGYEIPLGLIAGLSIAGALMMLLVVGMFVRSRRSRVHTGSQGLIGSRCLAMIDFDGEGRVWLHGEAWRASCDVAVRKNDVLEVISYEGLSVRVRPLGTTETSRPRSSRT